MTVLKMPAYNIELKPVAQSLDEVLSSAKYSAHFVLVDENTHVCCLPAIEATLKKYSKYAVFEIPSGEENKKLETCSSIWNEMLRLNLDRKAVMINLGGGVIGDMGGFVASTFKRGIDFIQIPTTLLSQVDASVGGKLGIDHNHLKNVVGLFADPKAVLIDDCFFETLDHKQLISGFAEMIKHALLDNMEHLRSLLTLDPLQVVSWNPYVERSITVKQRVVQQDPFENGLRKQLNFGHTYGHAFETYHNRHSKSGYTHGAAVAEGMMIAMQLSMHKCGFARNLGIDLINRIQKLYGFHPLSTQELPILLDFMKNDKKNHGTEYRFCLLKDVGAPELSVPVTAEEINAAIVALKSHFNEK